MIFSSKARWFASLILAMTLVLPACSGDSYAGDASALGSSTSTSLTSPSFTAGTVLEEAESTIFQNSNDEGMEFLTDKNYYSFTTSSSVICYNCRNGVLDDDTTDYTYDSSTGAMYETSESEPSFYIYLIGGNYYEVSTYQIPRTSGSGLYSTFSYSASDGNNSGSVSVTLSSSGKWTLKYYSETSSTGEYSTENISGTYTTSNGIIYVTGSSVWEVYEKNHKTNEKQKVSTTRTFSNRAAYYYDGSAIQGVNLLTQSSLPS